MLWLPLGEDSVLLMTSTGRRKGLALKFGWRGQNVRKCSPSITSVSMIVFNSPPFFVKFIDIRSRSTFLEVDGASTQISSLFTLFELLPRFIQTRAGKALSWFPRTVTERAQDAIQGCRITQGREFDGLFCPLELTLLSRVAAANGECP